ncbi:hypothetical protein BsIDN1_53240 [Bacillus safensis]|uniref:Uncharacterized protein n=1 Tax=Bacillus safensis TaxID=561879 RepID=A0A5S9MJB1_BACIA|nr:hypothetical protein BsIDN1_53240 [Bacillus safensis]
MWLGIIWRSNCGQKKKEREAYEKELNQTSNGEETPKEPKGYTKDILNKVIQIKVPKLNEEGEVVKEKKNI